MEQYDREAASCHRRFNFNCAGKGKNGILVLKKRKGDFCGMKKVWKEKEAAGKELLILAGGDLIIASAIFFFLIPSHAAISSISGLAIVLQNFLPLSVAGITFILNVFLLIVGFKTCGADFGFKTVFTSILLPVFLWLLELLFPHFQSLTGDQMLDASVYIFLVSIGQCILFNRNASSGGLDIVAKIMNHYLHMDLGASIGISGMFIALSSALVYDSKTVVISVLGTYLNGMVLDHFIFGTGLKRRVCIVSDKELIIKEFILNDLHSGASIYESYGAYTMRRRHEIITIVDRGEYQRLMTFLQKEDPKAFVTVYKVQDMRYIPKPIVLDRSEK